MGVPGSHQQQPPTARAEPHFPLHSQTPTRPSSEAQYFADSCQNPLLGLDTRWPDPTARVPSTTLAGRFQAKGPALWAALWHSICSVHLPTHGPVLDVAHGVVGKQTVSMTILGKEGQGKQAHTCLSTHSWAEPSLASRPVFLPPRSHSVSLHVSLPPHGVLPTSAAGS